MVNYQVKISQQSYRLDREHFTSVFDPIDQKLEDLKHESKPNSIREKKNRTQSCAQEDCDDKWEELMVTYDDEEAIEYETEEDCAFLYDGVEEEQGTSFLSAIDRKQEGINFPLNATTISCA